jgi:hypothetical protein
MLYQKNIILWGLSNTIGWPLTSSVLIIHFFGLFVAIDLSAYQESVILKCRNVRVNFSIISKSCSFDDKIRHDHWSSLKYSIVTRVRGE